MIREKNPGLGISVAEAEFCQRSKSWIWSSTLSMGCSMRQIMHSTCLGQGTDKTHRQHRARVLWVRQIGRMAVRIGRVGRHGWKWWTWRRGSFCVKYIFLVSRWEFVCLEEDKMLWNEYVQERKSEPNFGVHYAHSGNRKKKCGWSKENAGTLNYRNIDMDDSLHFPRVR
jgi:hypothetical protein